MTILYLACLNNDPVIQSLLGPKCAPAGGEPRNEFLCTFKKDYEKKSFRGGVPLNMRPLDKLNQLHKSSKSKSYT